MIPLVEEPKEEYEQCGIYENCVFCGKETKFWHWRTNQPVCKNCSKTHKVKELKKPKGYKVPTKQQFIKG